MEYEMIRVISAVLNTDPTVPGVIVEAGAYKGGSTAKISLVAAYAKRTLCVFDSFEGLPLNKEDHGKNIYGGDAYFPGGSYAGSLDEVKTAVSKYGDPNACTFVKGWFENTMTQFQEPVAVGYIDVDLVSSTKTCLTYLFPRLIKNGVLFSQDGHLPLIIRLLKDASFWKNEVKTEPPRMEGLGTTKLVEIRQTS